VSTRKIKQLRETVALIVVVAVAVAGGAGCRATESPPTDREWVANVRGIVDQLRGDVIAVSGFDRVGAARVGLRDESQLYGLLVSYTDFGGCRHMVAVVGAAPPDLAGVVHFLRRACNHLRAADRLFTRAVKQTVPHLLVGATLAALEAVPLLNAAALELSRRA
jgi:hypothetical protein